MLTHEEQIEAILKALETLSKRCEKLENSIKEIKEEHTLSIGRVWDELLGCDLGYDL